MTTLISLLELEISCDKQNVMPSDCDEEALLQMATSL